jgi:hypothetical protein
MRKDMTKTINSPNSFKTCYIAEVKEELGLLKRKLKKGEKLKLRRSISDTSKEQ